MPTHTELRLSKGIGNLLLTLSENVNPDLMVRESGITMKDVVGNSGAWAAAIAQWPWIPAALAAGGIAALALTPVALRRLWDSIKKKTGMDPHAGEPLPYRDIRRTGPRSDDKWWNRDNPSKVGEVPDSFYLETPDYEPWYLDQQAQGSADYRRDISGLPAKFQQLPDYLFKPKQNPSYPMAPSGNPFDDYDAITSRMPLAERRSSRIVEAQGGFSTNQRTQPSDVGSHPFANMMTPEDDESAASMGAFEGWYAPGSPDAPFLDPNFSKSDTAEWQPGGTPMETDIRRQQAMMGGLSDRMGQVMNWRVGQILAQLKGGTITQEKASENIWGLIDMMSIQGIPRDVAEETLRGVLEAVRSGQAGGLPHQMVGDVAIPERPSVQDWQSIGDPTSDPNRNTMMQGIDQQMERLKSLSPGFGSPLQMYTSNDTSRKGGTPRWMG